MSEDIVSKSKINERLVEGSVVRKSDTAYSLPHVL